MNSRIFQATGLLVSLAAAVGLAGCPPVTPPDGEDPVGWSHVIGGAGDDEAFAVERTSDGGFIVAGLEEAQDDALAKVLLLKLNADGSETWRKTYDGERDGMALDVDETSDGGYVLAGRFGAAGADTSDAFVLKTDANGVEAWRILIDSGGADSALSIDQRSGGGFLVSAQLDAIGASQAAVLALSGAGDEQWRVTAGEGTIAAEAESLADGSAVLAYWRLVSPALKQFDFQTEVALLKLDGNGIEQWQSVLGSETAAELRAIDPADDGGFILCGQADFLGEDSHVFLWKADAAGNLEWAHEYGQAGREIAHRVRAAGSGYIVAGTASPPNDLPHGFLLRVNGEGVETWTKYFGGDESDHFQDVEPVADGYVAAGFTESFGVEDGPAHHEIFVVRTDLNGNTPSDAGMVD